MAEDLGDGLEGVLARHVTASKNTFTGLHVANGLQPLAGGNRRGVGEAAIGPVLNGSYLKRSRSFLPRVGDVSK
jgi:hypothetical protein